MSIGSVTPSCCRPSRTSSTLSGATDCGSIGCAASLTMGQLRIQSGRATLEGSELNGASALPRSLLDGVERRLAAMLNVASLRHRSSGRSVPSFDGEALVDSTYRLIAENYRRAGSSAYKDRSRENWRWQSLQPQISAGNRSPEVIVERAIAAACSRLGRTDWANQVPVASGLVAGTRDNRRAIDLVRRRGERHFEFIELKIASDTPLYAAAEVLAYGCLWLIAREDKPARKCTLLDAERLDLRVLAPIGYYAGYALRSIEDAFDAGARALGNRHKTELSFAFEILDPRICADEIPHDRILLDLLDHPASAVAVTPE
ncbi:hypothetical protein [Roseomonas sp. AR75]|uniref:hypothetical protein n=1 Tax=Roseomonas sp. AR75 TaxID=2562311 RepID=UPI0010C15517|nr:hypothetical protein [Roseomonas sp. AR75]